MTLKNTNDCKRGGKGQEYAIEFNKTALVGQPCIIDLLIVVIQSTKGFASAETNSLDIMNLDRPDRLLQRKIG